MPLYSDYETRPVRLEPSHEEVDMATLLRDAALAGGLGGTVGLGAGRAMIPYEGLPPLRPTPSGPTAPPPGWADPEVMSRDLRAKIFPPPDAPGLLITNDPEVLRNRFTNEAFAPGANEVPRPGRLARLGAGAGRFAKAALNPVNIATDLLLGSAVGAGSAGAGYASAAPESAGLFTAPGPGYEGLVAPELIERIAEQKELEKEAERQRLLEQYRASGYDLDPNTRLSELR